MREARPEGRVKKTPNPQRFCVFCGGTPLSKEHILPAWMKDLLPDDFSATHHEVRVGVSDYGFDGLRPPPYSKGKLHRVGDHRSQKLRVVCVTCNTGWMSLLQRDAQPILTPLILGHPKPLTPTERATLAAWAAMFTMVYEYAEDRLIAAAQDDRHYLMRNRKAPPHWMIWHGAFVGTELNASTRHRAFKLNTRPVGEVAITVNNDVQTTVFATGRVIFQTFSSAVVLPDEVAARLRQSALRFSLRRLWPNASNNQFIKSPTGVVDDLDIPQIVEHVSHALIDTLRNNRKFVIHVRPPIMTNPITKKQQAPEQDLPQEEDALRRMLATPPKTEAAKPPKKK